jgi:hypothetical protein
MVEMRGIYGILTTKCASEIFSPEVRIDAKFWIRAGCITFVYCQCPLGMDSKEDKVAENGVYDEVEHDKPFLFSPF